MKGVPRIGMDPQVEAVQASLFENGTGASGHAPTHFC